MNGTTCRALGSFEINGSWLTLVFLDTRFILSDISKQSFFLFLVHRFSVKHKNTFIVSRASRILQGKWGLLIQPPNSNCEIWFKVDLKLGLRRKHVSPEWDDEGKNSSLRLHSHFGALPMLGNKTSPYLPEGEGYHKSQWESNLQKNGFLGLLC